MIDILSLIHSHWIIRLFVAILCGCLIGYERSNRNKEAGIRTHAIVSLGAALIMIVSKYGFSDIPNFDASRVASQIVSGVGFLGAGVIFVRHGNVSGLTTAAGMWATSGVGMCIGAGVYDVGIITTLFIVGLQVIFHKGFFLRSIQGSQNIQIEIIHHDDALKDIYKTFHQNGLDIQSIKIENLNDDIAYLDMEIVGIKSTNKDILFQEMMQKSYIKMFNYS